MRDGAGRPIWWGQVGNFVAFVIGLAGTSDKDTFIWGVVVTFIATVIGGLSTIN